MNPLGFHDRAFPAAAAFVAAHKQGKGHEYEKILWANTKALTDADLEGYAKQIGLDLAQWKKDKDSPEIKEWIDSQQAISVAMGAQGTPAFFINGENLSGAQPFEKFKEVIDRQLAQANKYIEAGVPLEKIHAGATYNAVGGKYRKYVVAGEKAPKPEAAPPKKDFADKAVDIVVGDSPRKGTGNEVIIAEFSDFQ